MIYELYTADGYRLGVFPTEAAARYHASYMPRGRYLLREWSVEGEFLIFDPAVNKSVTFDNWSCGIVAGSVGCI